MNKRGLILHLAESVELTQGRAAVSIESILSVMSGALMAG